MQRLFTIPFGDGGGRLHYRRNPLGVEIDFFPSRFIRDRRGNFIFLEQAPYSRLCRFAPSGVFQDELRLAPWLPAALEGRPFEPREIFLVGDGRLAALITVSSSDSAEARLLIAGADGVFQESVPLPDLDPAVFDSGAVALDTGGYLWAMRAGGVTSVFSPDGALYSEFHVRGSFVDPAGTMYTLTHPISLCDRRGRVLKALEVEGTETPPDSIDGGNRSVVFSLRRGEERFDGGVWRSPQSLDFFRIDKAAGRLVFVRNVELPDTLLTQPNLRIDIVYRTEVWGPRMLFETDGSLYLLGRSEEACWIARVETGVS